MQPNLALPFVISGLLLATAPARGASPVRFDLEVRPILSEHCFHCHGPDATSRKAKLRLDTE